MPASPGRILYGTGGKTAKNLAANARCTETTGCNVLNNGIDVVAAGEALRFRDGNRLRALAGAYASKFDRWHFTVCKSVLLGKGGEACAFEVAPRVAFAFAKGEPFGQTRLGF